MSAQVVLIIIGAMFLVVAITGSGDYVQFKIPQLRPWARIVLGVAGCGVFALAFIPFPMSIGHSSAAQPAGSSSSPATSTSSSPSVGKPRATLQNPTNGTMVNRSQGFIATGTAASLGSYTVWILDFDGGYTVDQEATVASGHWSAVDQPLGDSSNHLPYYLTMRAALANPHCAAILTRVNATNNDYIQDLPPGCKIIGQTIVKVSRP